MHIQIIIYTYVYKSSYTRILIYAHIKQPALDQAMEQEEQGRCFVRPSGTEDVVRIYAGAFL